MIIIDKHDFQYYENEPNFTCSACEKPLKIGDLLDSTFPWQAHFNRCRKCFATEEREKAENVIMQMIKKAPTEESLRIALKHYLEELFSLD